VLGGVADRSVLVDPALLAPALDDPGDPAGVRAAADAVAGSIDPDTDLHATADHRRRLVAVHTRRLLEQVLGADEGGTTR
jgi:CO/xanthine dehydrogenase FAD-binding subunit